MTLNTDIKVRENGFLEVHNVHWQLNWTCVLHGIIVQTQTLLKSINK